MNHLNLISTALALGLMATLFMDFWALLVKSFFNIKGLDYKLLGRWLVHMKRGKFTHNTILNSPETKNEELIGYLAHYLIGVSFAFILLLFHGEHWLSNPTFLPPFLVGIISIIAPFFIMQPCFGFGLAANKTPAPMSARAKSLMAHVSYGVGLYLSGQLIFLITH